jgi:hypothetical protein
MVGQVGYLPTKNYKFIICPLSEYLKNLYSYPSVYMLTNGSDGLIGWVGFGGFLPTPTMVTWLEFIGNSGVVNTK